MGSEYGCCCYAEVVTIWGRMLEEWIYAAVVSSAFDLTKRSWEKSKF